MLKIIPYFDTRLRLPNNRVEVFDKKLKTIIDEMYEVLYDSNGIGLAAPQVGINQQIFITDLEGENKDEEVPYEPILTYENNPKKTGKYSTKLVFINPKIEILDKEFLAPFTEGCLSVPETRADVVRNANIKITAMDIDGDTFVIDKPTGLFAICLQHEYDHINGKLFIDRLSSLKREKIVKGIKSYYAESRN